MRRQARVQPGSYDEPDAASLLRAAPPAYGAPPAYTPACAAVRPPAKLAPLPAKLAPLPPLPARAPIATPAPSPPAPAPAAEEPAAAPRAPDSVRRHAGHRLALERRAARKRALFVAAQGEREDRRRARAAGLPGADADLLAAADRDRSELAAFDAAAAREFRAQAAQAQATLLAALEAEQAAAADASDYDRHVGDARARLDAMLDEARATRAAAEERVVASSPRLPPPRPELDAHDRRGPALPPLRLPEETKEPPAAGDTGRSPAASPEAVAVEAPATPKAAATPTTPKAAPPAWEPHRERLDGEKTPEEYVAEREPFIRAALLLCVVVLVFAAYVAYAAFALWLDCRFRAVAAAWALGLALCAVALLGIWGCRRVRGDLLRYFETDADAVSADGLVVERPADTWGQGLLEVVFFCFLFLAILCAIFGACLLANGKLGATFAKSLKETRPGAFERTFGDVSSARGGRLLRAAMVEFGVELLACGALALLPLRPIERVVSQFFDEYWWRWLADFVKTSGARLVFLTRTNVLRKYVSQAAKAVSEKTRVDAYYANETWYGGFNATTAAKDRLELKTGAALLRDLAKIDRDYEKIARLQADAETRGVPWFHATYEELQANKSKALGDIVDFVVPDSACPHAFAEAKVEKMHPEPMSTYVKNWDAVAATLRESKYARFMDG